MRQREFDLAVVHLLDNGSFGVSCLHLERKEEGLEMPNGDKIRS